jgi:hypothetical protein
MLNVAVTSRTKLHVTKVHADKIACDKITCGHICMVNEMIANCFSSKVVANLT